MATRQEQIMMHLYRYIGTENKYAMHFATTQDGIAEALGISRGHASIVLKNLERKELVEHELKHPYGGEKSSRFTRRCYKLKTAGILATQDLFRKGAA